LEGEIPSPINPPSGCKFRLRCPNCLGEKCSNEEPVLKLIDNHLVACHLFD
jgi:oligopeptide/dipeptide ABC transporter ATP-binding protein